MPALAGAARMRYLRFLCFNAAGGLVWGTVIVLVGYAAGASYAQVQQSAGRYSALAIAALTVVFLLAWWIRRPAPPRGRPGAPPVGANTSQPEDGSEPQCLHSLDLGCR